MISIIVPVYNVEKYLNNCINSLVNQTHTDLEIILIDDGSTDSSGRICDEWKKKCGKIRVIHQKNSGVSRARNAGLKIASGQYIGFVDSDDFVEEDMYEQLEKAMNAGADIAVCGYNDVLNNKTTSRISHINGVLTREDAIQQCVCDSGWGLYIWNKLFRRELIYKNNEPIFFPEDVFIGEDAVWLMMILGRCDHVSYYSEAKYNYVSRQGSAVFQSKGPKKIESSKSRYYASFRCYEFILENSNQCANAMLRRCVFSARDVVCEYYIQNKNNKYYEWIDIFAECLKKYTKNMHIKNDFLFIAKNTLLLLLMKAKVPAVFIRLLF